MDDIIWFPIACCCKGLSYCLYKASYYVEKYDTIRLNNKQHTFLDCIRLASHTRPWRPCKRLMDFTLLVLWAVGCSCLVGSAVPTQVLLVLGVASSQSNILSLLPAIV